MAKANATHYLLIEVKNLDNLKGVGGQFRIHGKKGEQILLPAGLAVPSVLKKKKSYRVEVRSEDLPKIGSQEVTAVSCDGPVEVATGKVSTSEG